jgi:hypothetical protein
VQILDASSRCVAALDFSFDREILPTATHWMRGHHKFAQINTLQVFLGYPGSASTMALSSAGDGLPSPGVRNPSTGI